MTLEHGGSPGTRSQMAEDAGTKGKVNSPRRAQPGMKRRGNVEVRRPAGSSE